MTSSFKPSKEIESGISDESTTLCRSQQKELLKPSRSTFTPKKRDLPIKSLDPNDPLNMLRSLSSFSTTNMSDFSALKEKKVKTENFGAFISNRVGRSTS